MRARAVPRPRTPRHRRRLRGLAPHARADVAVRRLPAGSGGVWPGCQWHRQGVPRAAAGLGHEPVKALGTWHSPVPWWSQRARINTGRCASATTRTLHAAYVRRSRRTPARPPFDRCWTACDRPRGRRRPNQHRAHPTAPGVGGARRRWAAPFLTNVAAKPSCARLAQLGHGQGLCRRCQHDRTGALLLHHHHHHCGDGDGDGNDNGGDDDGSVCLQRQCEVQVAEEAAVSAALPPTHDPAQDTTARSTQR